MKKILALTLAAAMCVPVVALAACKDGADGKDGKDGADGVNGINGMNGVNGTNGTDGTDGTDGKSAYELYVEYNPDYDGDEAKWLDDLAAGKLASEHNYGVISYGKLVNGAASAGTAADGGTDLTFTKCVVKLSEPAVIPVGDGAEWTVNMGGVLAGGDAGVQLLTSSPDVQNGRIYFAVNAGKNIAYMGVSIDGTYFNYCWNVPAATIKGKHEYSLRYKDGVYGLSIDGGDFAPFTSVNHNQADPLTVVSPKVASDDLNDKIKAVTGEEYFSFVSLGASGFECTGKIGYLDIKTSSVYGYKKLAAHPLYGKKIYHLGSSISRGEANGGKSFAEQIAALTGSEYKKETVSGTTLSTSESNSYVARYPNLEVDVNKPDFLVLQLSTNDFTRSGIALGTVTNQTSGFDTATTAGAIEHIVSKVKAQSPDTAVIIYTCAVKQNWYKKTEYSGFINSQLKMIQAKWDNVIIVDLFNKETVRMDAWLSDDIHPLGHGYANLFTPNIINAAVDYLNKK